MSSLMVLVLIATAASVTFTVLYGFRSPWRSNIVGKMQFTKSVCLSATLVLTVINRLIDYPFKEFVSGAVLATLCIALWTQVVILVILQKEARQRLADRMAREAVQ